MRSRRKVFSRFWCGCAIALPLLLCGCSALNPERLSLDQRLAMFPTHNVPFEMPVTIRWNQVGVPFIEAGTDRDCAFALGLVHAHLRLTQMAMFRRIVQGRLSESGGPYMNEMDQTLRTIDFGYAAPEIVAHLPDRTRAWLQAFVDGLNWYQAKVKVRPPDYALLNLEDETWKIEDLIAIGRFSGTDVNWMIYLSLLNARLSPDWQQTWKRVLDAGADSTPSFGASVSKVALLRQILQGNSRSGSNAMVVAPEHSKTGAALLAADPHLALTLPNVWMAAGIKSPSYHVVGLMVPGLPAFGLGRNDDLAWSGTNMRAAASDLYNVAGEDLSEKREILRNRDWFDTDVVVRHAKEGPVVSDLPFFPARQGEVVALRWKGHETSDEFSAFLAAMRARNANEFRAAFATYGVGGMNMLCATRTGDICEVMATHSPVRDPAPPSDLVRRFDDPEAAWRGEANAMDLPFALDPPGGLLATANNRPAPTPFPIGYFYPTSERVDRLYQVLKSKDKLGVDDLAALQRDTMSLSALSLKDKLVPLLKETAAAPEFVRGLESWDGRYDADARGPVLFETLLFELATRLYGENGRIGEGKDDWSYLVQYLPGDLSAAADRQTLIAAALAKADEKSRKFKVWGDMHRLRIGHLLMNFPLIGGSFQLEEFGVGGSRNTVMKTAHGLVDDRHYASYGSQARQLCDMSDPDRTSFVLLGGEDGWLGSDNFVDQVPLWRQGRAVEMPLTDAGVAVAFPKMLTLDSRRAP